MNPTRRTPVQWQSLVTQWQQSGQSAARFVESTRGTAPRAAHRTVRDTLASYGSCHLVIRPLYKDCQCTNIFGSAIRIRRMNCSERRRLRLSPLYLRHAQRTRLELTGQPLSVQILRLH